MSSPEDTKKNLLEDASTLLMFSSAAKDIPSAQPSPVEETNKPIRAPSASPQPNNMSRTNNPGPAVAALSEASGASEHKDDHSMKAIVAAAALAAAASAPLPLQQRVHSKEKKELKTENEKLTEKESISTKESTSHSTAKAVSHSEHIKTELDATVKTAPPSIPEKAVQAKEKDPNGDVPSYAVDPDAGTIDCICEVNEDDGFTIQCDRCFRWQHASCFEILPHDVPDIYHCELCDPESFKQRNINVQEMREKQLHLFNDNDNASMTNDTDFAHNKRHHEDLEVEEDDRKKRRIASANDANRQSGTSVKSEASTRNDRDNRNGTNGRDRNSRDFSKNDSINGNSNANDDPSSNNNTSTEAQDADRRERNKKKKKEDFDDNTNEELITRIESAKDEYFYAVFFNLKQLEYSNKELQHYFQNVLPKFLLAQNWQGVQLSSKDLRNSIKGSVQVRNILQNESNMNIPASQLKFSGLSNLGVFTTDSSFTKGQFIEEFLGEVDTQLNFFKNPINQFKHWGLPKNYYFFVNFNQSQDMVTQFEKYLELRKETQNQQSKSIMVPVYLNCKTSGNILRFVRKSCDPNCRITPVLVEEKEVRFILQAIKPIEKDSELTVSWEFEFNNLYSRLYGDSLPDNDKSNDVIKTNFNSKLTNSEKVQLINQVEFILNQYKCGCYTISSKINANKCKLLRIKKMGSYFYRSSRKGSKLSKSDSNSKQMDVNEHQKSIKARLENRHQIILRTINSLNNAITVEKKSRDLLKSAEPKATSPIKEIKSLDLTSKRKYSVTPLDHAILNSRFQLSKAVAANCLTVPFSVKSGVLKIFEKKSSKNVVKSKNEQAEKKVKKMSFADFLKNKSG